MFPCLLYRATVCLVFMECFIKRYKLRYFLAIVTIVARFEGPAVEKWSLRD